MIIRYHKDFEKSFKKLDQKIKIKTQEKLIIFQNDPFDIRLRNHALIWKYKELRSIDITGDYRLIFKELSDGSYELVELLNVWTHSQLY